MTRQQALLEFKHLMTPHGNCHVCYFKELRTRSPVLVRTSWNNFTDMLHKDGRITAKQYETWTNPF